MYIFIFYETRNMVYTYLQLWASARGGKSRCSQPLLPGKKFHVGDLFSPFGGYFPPCGESYFLVRAFFLWEMPFFQWERPVFHVMGLFSPYVGLITTPPPPYKNFCGHPCLQYHNKYHMYVITDIK